MARPERKGAAKGRLTLRARRERGLSLAEVLVALAIVAIAVLSINRVAEQAQIAAAEANFLRAAKRLLLQKAWEIVAGVEEGQSGSFESFPSAYTWSVDEEQVQLEDVGEEEFVRSLRVRVTYPTAGGSGGFGNGSAGNELTITVFLDPVDAELKPPPQGGQGGAGGQGGR